MPEQLRAILVMGSPSSGKTSYALSDRFSGFDYHSPTTHQDRADLRLAILKSMSLNRNIVIDDYNNTVSGRNFYLDIIKNRTQIRQYQLECHHLRTRLHDIRDNGRDRQSRGGDRLNVSKLIKYRSALEAPSAEEGFASILTLPFQRIEERKYTLPAVFMAIDALRYSQGPRQYPTKTSNVGIFPDVTETLCRLLGRGFKFIIVGNMPEIGARTVHRHTAHDCVIETIKQLPVPIDDFLYSELSDGPDSLPNPTFAFVVREKHKINLSQSVMVGVNEVDKKFAENAGFGLYLPRKTFFWNGQPRLEQRHPHDEVRKLFAGG